MYLAQPLVHHPAEHFGKPVVEAGKGRKDGGTTHGEMEMAHH
jgi:molybdenum-dependent DNA-binding transcriptional regulator ModE